VQRRQDIDAKRSVQLGKRIVIELRHGRRTQLGGVIDKYVDPTEPIEARFHEPASMGLVCDVSSDGLDRRDVLELVGG